MSVSAKPCRREQPIPSAVSEGPAKPGRVGPARSRMHGIGADGGNGFERQRPEARANRPPASRVTARQLDSVAARRVRRRVRRARRRRCGADACRRRRGESRRRWP
jgi:hypothetical protein